MKAELMIGDLVIRRGVPEEPMRICGMNALAGVVYLDQDGRGVTEKFENIEPIPLTKEILEKNGWEFDELDRNYYSREIHFSILGGELPYIIFDGVEIGYVHELQHALELCKIKKGIVL